MSRLPSSEVACSARDIETCHSTNAGDRQSATDQQRPGHTLAEDEPGETNNQDWLRIRPFEGFTPNGVSWPDGRETVVDTVIWCTGFRAALDHLAPLGVLGPDGHIAVNGTRSIREPRLWLVGYGEWTGYASATIVGVGCTARSTVAEIDAVFHSQHG